jgi:hypothetical protein
LIGRGFHTILPAHGPAQGWSAGGGPLQETDPVVAVSDWQVLHRQDPTRCFIVDFDYTLCDESSTDIFLSQARPAALYMPILKVVGFLARRLLPGRPAQRWGDPIRIAIAILICPWILVTFRRQAGQLFATYRNQRLIDALAQVPVDRIVIVSFGLDFILRALLAGTRLEGARLVAPALGTAARHRRIGKLEVMRQAAIPVDPARDIVITDSWRDDADLLGHVRHAYLVKWPPGATPNPMNLGYVPLYYTARIKRDPGFLIKQVFLEEMLVFLLLFSLAFIPGDWTVPAALVLLFLSYLVVYEIGYADNDLVGHQREAAPKLSAAFFANMDYIDRKAAWAWSLALGLAGVALLSDAARHGIYARAGLAVPEAYWQDLGLLVLVWMGCVFLGYLLFRAFNRAPLFWRVFLYLPLQAGKMLSPLVFFPISAAGAALFMAHLVRMWAPYAIRRAGGDIERTSSQLIRLVFVVAFLPVIALIEGSLATLLSWQAGVVVLFCALRAAPEARRKAASRPGL